ncbi:MAG: branched-chain amino acid ABC transporter permease [Bdellovibrionaceae bacterium]|nr:branched-chain amino acid ABC transporter permease [Pseudobdellovibrionaceae bacterium]MDW8190019.1 branched-chain amino acid ABC transporter permease [Pseudobdellovibrionaceae bacterium]
MGELIQHLINGVGLGAIYALIALGYTMVYGVLQLINFAHAEVYMVAAFAAFYANKGLLEWLNAVAVPGWVIFAILLLVAVGVGGGLAVLIEAVAYRPLRGAPRINILITAIGVSLLIQNLAQIGFGADPKFFQPSVANASLFTIGDSEVLLYDVTVLLVTTFFLCVLHYLVYHTQMGIAMRAVSYNPVAASLLGVSINQTISFTFFLGGALAGVAAVLIPLKYPKIEPLMGTLLGLKAFVAAVLGGIGHIGGTVLGAFMLGMAEQMVAAYLSSMYRDAIAFSLLIVVLLLKPEGLFGKKGIEKV